MGSLSPTLCAALAAQGRRGRALDRRILSSAWSVQYTWTAIEEVGGSMHNSNVGLAKYLTYHQVQPLPGESA